MTQTLTWPPFVTSEYLAAPPDFFIIPIDVSAVTAASRPSGWM